MQIIIYGLDGKKIAIAENLSIAKQLTAVEKHKIVNCLHNRKVYAKEYQFRYKYGKHFVKKLPKIR